MGNLGRLSLGVAIGVVLGILAVLWVRPDNAGGSALLIVFCTALTVIAGAILKAVRGR